jgi:membrane protein
MKPGWRALEAQLFDSSQKGYTYQGMAGSSHFCQCLLFARIVRSRIEMKIKTFVESAKEYFARVREDNATDLAAQLAFYFLLSLFPFLVFTITLLGYTHITAEDVLELIQQFAPGETLDPIRKNLQEVFEQRKGGLLSFSILGTIWAASAALNATIGALNRAYGVSESRPFLKARAVAILLTFMMILVILISLVLPVFGEMILRLVSLFLEIPPIFSMIWTLMRWVVSFCILVGAFVIIYYLAPNKKLRIRGVIIGALFAAIGWQVTSLAFSFYLDNFANYPATYGGLGTIIALMIWFYLTALIIILGGELNAMLHARHERKKNTRGQFRKGVPGRVSPQDNRD